MGSKSGDNRGQEGLSRRAFIQRASAIACALGLAEFPFALNSQKAKDYSQAIADTTGRKLALLIGIDSYADNTLPANQPTPKQLVGAVTDVALQRELLIHRFGFLPEDIVCLTNRQATRKGIYEAFINHLHSQATSDDVVVFHFSGYGSQVKVNVSDQDRISNLVGNTAGNSTGSTVVLRSLVPFDGLVPTETRPAINDILEIELKALLGQLKTKKITTVIDAGFVDIALPLLGGLRSRTRADVLVGKMPAPFDLLANKRSTKKNDAFPGVLLRGADVDDIVLERQWNDFSAGAFTYVLTQYLWAAPAPVTTQRSLSRAQETLLRWGGSSQQPAVSAIQPRDTPIYNTPLPDGTRGEGVITEVSSDGRSATVWLGGLPPRVLEYLKPPAVITAGGSRLSVRSHSGLTGRVRLIDGNKSNSAPLQVGMPIFESIRALPKNPTLVVALDSRLERIERVDATSALASLPFVTSTSDTGLPADCLLAKPLDAVSGTLTANLNPTRLAQYKSAPEEIAPENLGSVGYGLFSLTRSLISGTLSLQEEAIKPAINRLSDKMRSLMALKILRLSENRAASKLPVRVILEEIGERENKLIISRQTFKLEQKQTGKGEIEGFIPEVSIGSRVRYRLFNDGNKPLYYTLINVDPRERLSAFCPATVDTSASSVSQSIASDNGISAISAASILPGSSVAVPGADLDWPVVLPAGPIETYVICTTRPLDNTFNLLLKDINNGGQRINPLPTPLEVIKAILSDISRDDGSDSYNLDMAEWATLNFTYQAV